MIELQQAEKLYGRTRQQQQKDGKGFHSMNITIPDGQIVGVLGENGAGKSTLLRAIVGLTSLTNGQILLDGKPASAQYSQLAYLTGEGTYPSNVTPRQYQAFLQDFYPHFNGKRYQSLLHFFALDPDQTISKFSTGQRAKLELAAGMGKQAKYLIMDEPFLGKDVFSRRDFIKLLAGSLRGDETILLSSHYVEEIEPLLDRVLILHKGQLVTDVLMDDMRENGNSLMQLLADAVDYDSQRCLDLFAEEDV